MDSSAPASSSLPPLNHYTLTETSIFAILRTAVASSSLSNKLRRFKIQYVCAPVDDSRKPLVRPPASHRFRSVLVRQISQSNSPSILHFSINAAVPKHKKLARCTVEAWTKIWEEAGNCVETTRKRVIEEKKQEKEENGVLVDART